MKSFGNQADMMQYLSRCKAVDVDLAADSTVAVNAPCEVLGYWVNVVMSAHTCPVQDDTTLKVTIPASSAAGTYISFPGAVEFLTNLTIDPNDAATGHVTFFYRLL